MKYLLYILIPLLLFGGAELFFRQWKIYGDDYGLPYLAENPEEQNFDVLFLGSSRVAASINTEVFEDVLARTSSTYDDPKVLNYGFGYTTMFQYYATIKRMAENNEDAFKGKYVFLEAPAGIPFWNKTSDPWIVNQSDVRMVTSLLDNETLNILWKESDYDFEEKMRLSLLHAGQKSDLYSKRYYFRIGIINKLGGIIDNNLTSKSDQGKKDDNPEIEMDGSGGIRTDQKGVEQVRDKVLSTRDLYVEDPDNTNPTDYGVPFIPSYKADWEKSRLRDIVEIVQEHGGTVVFFEMPVSSPIQEMYNLAVTPSEFKTFKTVSTKWETPLMSTGLLFDDSDFPDLLHMTKEAQSKFSEALAREFSRYLEGQSSLESSSRNRSFNP